MSEYKGIKGFQVQTRTEDPSPTEAQAGDFYYNSSTGQFKNIITGGAPLGSWSSGGSINQTRSGMGRSMGGTLTAGIIHGGIESSIRALTELYNGTSWTESGDMSAGIRNHAATGTQTAASAISGTSGPGALVATVENFNGSSWTDGTSINEGREQLVGVGLQTAGLVFGGNEPPVTAATELWNGSSWTEVNDLNTARVGMTGIGTSTAAYAVSGNTPPSGSAPNFTTNVEEWNGSSWTVESNINTKRSSSGASGTIAKGFIFGGVTHTAYVTNTEAWDGSSWSEVADLGTGVSSMGSGGTSDTSAFSAGGNRGPANTNATEEWTAADFQIKSVTTS